jgi:DNA-binding MarR family transcriptional regulator
VRLLNASVGYMLRRAQLAVSGDFGETLAEIGLRPGQFAVLTVLDHNPGVTQSEVSAALSIQRANFVSIIDNLERRGLAKRTSSATDRRSNSLTLTTPAGACSSVPRTCSARRTFIVSGRRCDHQQHCSSGS